jgi:hypothetical protein
MKKMSNSKGREQRMCSTLLKSSIIMLLLAGILLQSPYADAMPKQHKMTFGETCYSNYGAGNKERSVTGAMLAVRQYFTHRGFNVKLVEHNINFLRVEVSKEREIVDIIIVDIKSGRMRSVE